MLEILPSPKQVAAVRISGRLTAEDFDQVVAHIEAKLAEHDRIGVLVDMTGFEDFTWEAAAKDVQYGLSKLGDLKRFAREAVVSDKQWVRTTVAMFKPFVPFVELEVFPPGDLEGAMAWAAGF